MNKIKIGKIVNVAGLKGEVKIYNYSDSNERYARLNSIYVEDTAHRIEKVRYVKRAVILKLSGIDSREAAEEARGKDIYITEKDLPELAEDEYFIRDLIGVLVFDDAGNIIGELCNVIQNSAQDIYEIETENGKRILIPAVGEFILNIDIKAKRMDVKLIEGLIE